MHSGLTPIDDVCWRQLWKSFQPQACSFCLTVPKLPRLDNLIRPWQFGHGETKATCLWLKNLPLLRPTQIVDGRAARIHHMRPSPERWKERSRAYEGIAKAMAAQWSVPS